jgi:hypothetical protein
LAAWPSIAEEVLALDERAWGARKADDLRQQTEQTVSDFVDRSVRRPEGFVGVVVSNSIVP